MLCNDRKKYKSFTLKIPNQTFTSYAALFFLSAIWGSSFLFIKLSINSIPPTLLTFYRLLIASFFLLLFYKKMSIKKILLGNRLLIFGIAIFGNVIPFNLISMSEVYVDSVVASTLIGTMPFFTFLLSYILFKNQRSYFFSFLGIVIGFLGMIVFINPSEVSSANTSFIFSSLIVLSAFFYAFSANLVKKIKNYSSLEIATLTTILATILSFPFLLLNLFVSGYMLKDVIVNITYQDFISATILGVVCTGLAAVVFFYIIKIRTAVFASQSNYLIPCFGSVWSYFFLQENLSQNMLYGLILIVIGGWIVNKSLK